MNPRSELTPDDIAAFQPDAKIGLLATRDRAGLPHVTLITTLAGKDPTHLTWGQFCAGQSKRNVAVDARVGFLVLDLQRRWWRGKARWTGAEGEGDDFVAYNQRPMFRYNSYFGIHAVHSMDLVSVVGPAPLSVGRLAAGFAVARAGGLLAWRRGGAPALGSWTRALLGRPDTLGFLAYVDADGFPVVVPAVAAGPAGSHRVALATAAHAAELDRIGAAGDGGAPVVALYALDLAMESVLVRGRLVRGRRAGPLGAWLLEVDWVYNSMPPQQGQIYPAQPLEPVRHF